MPPVLEPRLLVDMSLGGTVQADNRGQKQRTVNLFRDELRRASNLEQGPASTIAPRPAIRAGIVAVGSFLDQR
jgi:hypothetical protein